MRAFILALAFTAIAVLPNVAAAAEFTLEPLSIQVPEGFEGPISQSQGSATLVVFTRPNPDTAAKTLLQISIYDFGEKLRGLPDTARGVASERYLLQFLAGVERRRTDFKRSDPVHITLSGIPAAKVTWSGRADGTQAVGTMYCVIVGTQVVSFHTQDAGTEPTPAMKEAVDAIEAVKVSVGAAQPGVAPDVHAAGRSANWMGHIERGRG